MDAPQEDVIKMEEVAAQEPVTQIKAEEVVSPEVVQKVLKQIQYYFSDSNFVKDKFLKEAASKDADGWIGLDIVTDFPRVKQLANIDTIRQILKDSPESASYVLSNDGTRIKRAHPLPEEDTSDRRTIYVKGWPKDTTIDSVTAFYEQLGYKVLAIRLRRTKDKHFKGSVFIEFSTEAEANDEIQKKNSLQAETPFIVRKKGDYLADKALERSAYRKGAPQKTRGAVLKNAGTQNPKKRREPSGGPSGEGPEDAPGEPSGEAPEDTPSETPGEAPHKKEFASGLVLKYTEIGAGATRDLMKNFFGAFGEVAFVDLGTSGFIRFKEASSASKAFESMTAEPKEIKGKIPTVSIISGDEEKEYYAKVYDIIKKKGNSPHRGGRGGRGGSGGKRRRFNPRT